MLPDGYALIFKQFGIEARIRTRLELPKKEDHHGFSGIRSL
jgi:hypothetical protein